MISFKQFLAEIGDSNIQLSVISRPHIFATQATIAGREMRFAAVLDNPLTWELRFTEMARDDLGVSSNSYKKTGSGGEFGVTAFVVNSVKQFLEKKNPAAIYFSAEKDAGSANRVRVYDKMAERLLKGYTKEKIEDEAHASFIFIRKPS